MIPVLPQGTHPAVGPLEGTHPAVGPLEGTHPAVGPLEGTHPAVGWRRSSEAITQCQIVFPDSEYYSSSIPGLTGQRVDDYPPVSQRNNIMVVAGNQEMGPLQFLMLTAIKIMRCYLSPEMTSRLVMKHQVAVID